MGTQLDSLPTVPELQSLFVLAVSVLLLGVKVFALVDCVARKPVDVERASQVSRNGWLVILALSIAVDVLWWGDPIHPLGLIGTVAALVYLAQLRGSTH